MDELQNRPNVVLLRRELRLADNPALAAACAARAPVIAVFVLDDGEAFAPQGAGRWWLHKSLDRLGKSLSAIGVAFALRRGPMAETAFDFALEAKAGAVFWNRRYELGEIAADRDLKTRLSAAGIGARSFNGRLVREPWELQTGAGAPYRVFTPFWRALRAAGPSRTIAAAPRKARATAQAPVSDSLGDWRLLPTEPDWAREFAGLWTPGEAGAQAALARFLEGPATDYAETRDQPGAEATSRLSPHLAFGEISPLTIWRAVHARVESGAISEKSADKFLSEIAWREFNHSLLYYNPHIADEPINKKFEHVRWRSDKDAFAAWTRGATGYPIVDAAMRELWRTGWTHNRARMIAASFLVKHLMIDWREGERWFRTTLVDADAANNPANWQWVAGCGADAAPWFRIFNPVLQGEKFDAEGAYVRRFVPELAKLPSRYIHKPWAAPADVRTSAGVRLGSDYPRPIVDHAQARRRALAVFDPAQ
ncbi:MAG: deoxyribodipyrimidine photo-lyase [Alphaproteobacteria bacterium]|nr:deoxyribodipyrimidine photo-lyase [Alphaproteobacteria bacterium]